MLTKEPGSASQGTSTKMQMASGSTPHHRATILSTALWVLLPRSVSSQQHYWHLGPDVPCHGVVEALSYACRIITGSYLLDASTTALSPGVTTKNVFRQCPMSPGGQSQPQCHSELLIIARPLISAVFFLTCTYFLVCTSPPFTPPLVVHHWLLYQHLGLSPCFLFLKLFTYSKYTVHYCQHTV